MCFLVACKQDSSGVEDWRRDLLAAVGGLLEHQRGVLTTTLSASVYQGGQEESNDLQQLLHEQV